MIKIGGREAIKEVPIKGKRKKFVLVVRHDEDWPEVNTTVGVRVYGPYKTYKQADVVRHRLMKDQDARLKERGDYTIMQSMVLSYDGIGDSGSYSYTITELLKYDV